MSSAGIEELDYFFYLLEWTLCYSHPPRDLYILGLLGFSSRVSRFYKMPDCGYLDVVTLFGSSSTQGTSIKYLLPIRRMLDTILGYIGYRKPLGYISESKGLTWYEKACRES